MNYKIRMIVTVMSEYVYLNELDVNILEKYAIDCKIITEVFCEL